MAPWFWLETTRTIDKKWCQKSSNTLYPIFVNTSFIVIFSLRSRHAVLTPMNWKPTRKRVIFENRLCILLFLIFPFVSTLEIVRYNAHSQDFQLADFRIYTMFKMNSTHTHKKQKRWQRIKRKMMGVRWCTHRDSLFRICFVESLYVQTSISFRFVERFCLVLYYIVNCAQAGFELSLGSPDYNLGLF